MKFNSFVTVSVTGVFLIQSLLMPIGVLAQTPTFTMPTMTAPNFLGNSATDANINKLNTWQDVVNSNATTDWKAVTGSKDSSGGTTGKSCQKCEAPSSSTTPACSMFGAKKAAAECSGGDAECYKATPAQYTKFNQAKEDWDQQVKCLTNNRSCSDPDLDQLSKELETMMTEIADLEKGVQNAGSAVRQAFESNIHNYQKAQVELDSAVNQAAEMDKVLLGDPTKAGSGDARFKGLLALNRDLKESLEQFNSKKAEFQNELSMIENEEKANEQFLVVRRAEKVKSCLMTPGSVGGQQLTCFQPQMRQGEKGPEPILDRNGRPLPPMKTACSPLGFIESKIAQSAFVNNGKGVLKNARNTNDANAMIAAFGGIQNRLLTGLGGASGSAGGGEGEVAPPLINSWKDVESRIGAEIDAMPTKVTVRNLLQRSMAECFNQADEYRNGLVRADNASSPYIRKKLEIDTKRRGLNSNVGNAMNKLKSNFTDVVAALTQGRQHSPLTLQQCPSSDAKKVLSAECMGAVQNRLQTLQEGSREITSFKFAGTQEVVIQCQGLDGCISRLQSAQTEHNRYVTNVKNTMTKAVADVNEETTKGLEMVGKQLLFKQNKIDERYKKAKELMIKMGLSPKDKLNTVEKEALEQIEGKEGMKGPYKTPNNIAAVLSGYMGAGLYNFKDLGLNDILSQLKEKKDEKKKQIDEDLKSAKETLAQYSALPDTCNEKNGPKGASSSNGKADDDLVKEMHTACESSDCTTKLTACETANTGNDANANSVKDIIGALKALQKADASETNSKWDKIDEELKDNTITGKVTGCEDLATKCASCRDKAKKVQENWQEKVDNATKAISN